MGGRSSIDRLVSCVGGADDGGQDPTFSDRPDMLHKLLAATQVLEHCLVEMPIYLLDLDEESC